MVSAPPPQGPALSWGILCHPKSSPGAPQAALPLLPQPARSCSLGQPVPWAPQRRQTREPPGLGPMG